MTGVRDKSTPPTAISSLSKVQLEELRTLGAKNNGFWNTENPPYNDYVAKFRQEIKEHYFWGQKSMCCYCCKPLQIHKRGYDAEHIIDKSTYPQHMFDPKNLAASCIACNGRKQAKAVLKENVDASTIVPSDSEDYIIVHPHLDEWSAHLDYDEIGRIVALPGNIKGKETIRICGIEYINAITLANIFSPDVRGKVYDYLISVLSGKPKKRLAEHTKLLEALAEKVPAAKAALGRMREQLG